MSPTYVCLAADLVVFGEKEFEEWKDLSSLLQPGAKLEERANALAFVVKQCLRLLDERQFHTLAGQGRQFVLECFAGWADAYLFSYIAFHTLITL